MVAIAMSVEAYRQGTTMYFDAVNERVIPSPPRAYHVSPREEA
jgi:hypothetical protein